MTVTAVVEIPQGSFVKYEHCKDTGVLLVDRALNQPVPYSYGYIPGTLCGDGDPLDIFIVFDESIYPLAQVKVDIVGALRCTDNGESDDKILAFISGDSSKPHGFASRLIANYLETYKKGFVVHEYLNQEQALEVYKASVEAYQKNKPPGDQL